MNWCRDYIPCPSLWVPGLHNPLPPPLDWVAGMTFKVQELGTRLGDSLPSLISNPQKSAASPRLQGAYLDSSSDSTAVSHRLHGSGSAGRHTEEQGTRLHIQKIYHLPPLHTSWWNWKHALSGASSPMAGAFPGL